ncbi:PREDICTED: uncharacterized protein LOC108553413 [Eufriesea mexicana]|uniref:uncharacterized protein LOC108553413 n=1 Tax=Eufriesea mexicana TaxID=516756 RepID=UPI00083C1FB0|nr:PREDICTED: uncharacterized protein LOC108553413 [Eufriesea mexicana]
MQKGHPTTPKLRRIKRVHSASVSDLSKKNTTDGTTNIYTGSSHHRATMNTSDFALPQGISKRKIILDRSSIFPSQSLPEGSRIIDAECSDMELKLLYDQYLQKIMSEIIVKKNAEKYEKLFLSELATIAKECEHNETKLLKLETRERDITNLIKLQDDIDSQIIDANNCIKGDDNEMLEKILSQLHTRLQPLDVLRCNNIVLPDTPEEWEETSKTLKSCSETLKSIMNLIGTKNESYQNISKNIKEFVDTVNNIEEHRKRLEKELCNLQALALKTASLTLMQNHN